MSSTKAEKSNGILKNHFQQAIIGKQTIFYSYCGNFIIFEREGLYRITLDDNIASDELKERFVGVPKQELSGELSTVVETYKNLK